MTLRALLVCIMMALSTPLLAVGPDEILSDPALESRARELSAGLRCLVCQNQSIDDSDADLARDLRLLVRARLVRATAMTKSSNISWIDTANMSCSIHAWARTPSCSGLPRRYCCLPALGPC